MSWKILDMQHQTSDGLVITVFASYEVWDGPGFARKVFTENFEGPAGPEFIPYDDLTEEIVLGWVFDRIGETVKSEAEAEVTAAALAKKQEIETPAVTNGKPWVVEDGSDDGFDPIQNQGDLSPE